MSDHRLNDAARPYGVAEYVSPFAPLIDQLYREEVCEARKMSVEAKFLAGEELFEYACSITMGGIKSENPNFTEAECCHELNRRLELGRRLERHS